MFADMVLLNPVFNCSKSLLSSSVDKVTTGAYDFVPVIGALIPSTGLSPATASLIALLVITQFSDQSKSKILHNQLMAYLIICKNCLHDLMTQQSQHLLFNCYLVNFL